MKKTPATTAKRLTSPRHYRALQELLKGPCTVRQLIDRTGANGIPQLIVGLRKKGLKIETLDRHGIDRDGRRIWYGEYILLDESRELAEKLINASNFEGV